MMLKKMKILFFVVVLALIFTSCASKRRRIMHKSKPIVGGVPAEIGKYPYQVSVGHYEGYSPWSRPEKDEDSYKNETDSNRPTDHFCGASIISIDWVLCAAHCLTGEEPHEVSIRVGTITRDKGGHVHEVDKIIIHPDYDVKVSGDSDIALIKVKVPFQIGPNVQPIQLNKNPIRPGSIVTVTGWGDTKVDEGLPEILQRVNVPVVPQWECEWLYGREKLSDTMFCAGRAGRDSCQGDSGGPVVQDEYLVGVVSWGYGCALPGYPGVYTDVRIFLDWIQENSGVY